MSRSPLSRRSLLRGGLGAGGLLLLAACGDSPDPASPNGAAWEFTDDRGKKVTRPQRPTTIVAQISAAAALWDLGIRPVGTFGESRNADGTPTMAAGSIDLSKVTSISETFGEFNLEKYATLKPELLITQLQVKNELWYVPATSVEPIEAHNPIVAISHLETTVPAVIDRYAALAKALGADLAAEPVTKAKTEFDQASKGLREAKLDALKVLFISATADNAYLGIAPAFADLRMLSDLGVRFVTPKADAADPHWETLSWEQVGKYPADVILYDERTRDIFTKTRIPTYQQMPAVKAGQTIAWNPTLPASWAGFAPALRKLTADLSRMRPLG
ncbi:ABC transporter substrate-binding protein [Kribbella sp. NBC_01245]|uniref:ABC transporter substrate-binding protein n=1 Tax=Kribbella sp. NBC_01245 TaxID=2903578 RepID=UPI002E2975AF|nr:ABC transporter substrate-binding protein [Kribbella sp. NBC_01245]